MDVHYQSVLEKRVMSLDSTTLLILSRAAQGYSDEEIVTWSEGWKFSLTKIERAFRDASEAFELAGIKHKKTLRRRVIELYKLGAEKLHPPAPAHKFEKASASSYPFYYPNRRQKGHKETKTSPP